ncbi:helix-turn-helix transcriptional regulator [Pseudophaeobacter sp. A-200-2]|uniref:helix-turn-helix transcriptional regulator n=1 Tax=Pseudophaeobacter sp. A-200-2 TaxID=3098145 RepID=UPI0034D50D59
MPHSEPAIEKPDLATVEELAEFFRLDRTAVRDVMTAMGVPKRGRGYPWIRIWRALGLDLKTAENLEDLKIPLLNLKQVAAKLGESAKTTRRRSNGEHRDKSIPAYIELGPRKRLFFPAEIESWLLGEQLPFGREQKKLSFIPGQAKKLERPKKHAERPRPHCLRHPQQLPCSWYRPNQAEPEPGFPETPPGTYLLSAPGKEVFFCLPAGCRHANFISNTPAKMTPGQGIGRTTDR